MPHDVRLAERVRRLVRGRRGLSEKEQFGGVAFLVNGNVACGVIADGLLVRVGPERHDEAMKIKGAGLFSLTGRPSKGWILVDPAALKATSALKRWVELGWAFAGTLPAK